MNIIVIKYILWTLSRCTNEQLYRDDAHWYWCCSVMRRLYTLLLVILCVRFSSTENNTIYHLASRRLLPLRPPLHITLCGSRNGHRMYIVRILAACYRILLQSPDVLYSERMYYIVMVVMMLLYHGHAVPDDVVDDQVGQKCSENYAGSAGARWACFINNMIFDIEYCTTKLHIITPINLILS